MSIKTQLSARKLTRLDGAVAAFAAAAWFVASPLTNYLETREANNTIGNTAQCIIDGVRKTWANTNVKYIPAEKREYYKEFEQQKHEALEEALADYRRFAAIENPSDTGVAFLLAHSPGFEKLQIIGRVLSLDNQAIRDTNDLFSGTSIRVQIAAEEVFANKTEEQRQVEIAHVNEHGRFTEETEAVFQLHFNERGATSNQHAHGLAIASRFLMELIPPENRITRDILLLRDRNLRDIHSVAVAIDPANPEDHDFGIDTVLSDNIIIPQHMYRKFLRQNLEDTAIGESINSRNAALRYYVSDDMHEDTYGPATTGESYRTFNEHRDITAAIAECGITGVANE